MTAKMQCSPVTPFLPPFSGRMGRMRRVIAAVCGVFAAVRGEEVTLQEAIDDLRQVQAGQAVLEAHRAWMNERAAAELLAHGLASGDGERFRCPMPGGCH